MPFHIFGRDHLPSNMGITSGPASFVVQFEDHLRTRTGPCHAHHEQDLGPLNIAGFHVTSSFSQLKISHSPEVLVSSDIRVSKNDVLQRLSSKGFFVLL